MLNKAVLPKDWDTTTIGVSCDILDRMRIPVNSSDRFERKGVIPYYGANGLQGWIDDCIFDEELVLIAEDGGYFDEFENRPIAYMIRGKSWVNNHAHVLRARKQITTNHWIFYNLVHKDIQYYIQGGTRSKLNQSELRNIEVPLPSLPEQRRIAEILDTRDEAIEKTEALISKLKAMKQGLLHDLLTRGLGKNGKLRDPKAHPEQFKDSQLGKIPKGWVIQELGKAALKIQDGTHFSPKTTSGPFRYMTSKNIRFGHVDLSDCGWISEKEHEAIYSRCDVRYGDVLLTKDGANTGNAAINNLNEPVSLLSSVAFIRCDDRTLHPEYVFLCLLSPGCQQRIKDLMSGNAITRLTLERIKSFVFPVPDIKEQLKIIEPLNSHDARIRTEEQYRDKLKLQKKGLMHDLLTGKVRVKM